MTAWSSLVASAWTVTYPPAQWGSTCRRRAPGGCDMMCTSKGTAETPRISGRSRGGIMVEPVKVVSITSK